MSKKILVSGVKPTGVLHLGNYFGAMKQFVDFQNSGDFDIFVFIANYHALTSVHNKKDLESMTFDVVCAYLAIGLDPEKTVLYRQSAVSEHTELTWIFNCLTTMPYLMRAHAFKDAEAKNKDINVGTFDYPILMAADILMYNADVVAVGRDQVQHVEMTREIGRKFNQVFNVELFKDPEAYSKDQVQTVTGTDGQKMSKSYNNVIPLFGSVEEITRAVMGIVTDSKGPEETKNPDDVIIYQLYTLVATDDEQTKMREGFKNGGLGYGDAKKELLRKILEVFSPMKKRYDELQANPEDVYAILEKGERRVKSIAQTKMQAVRSSIGL